MKEVIKLIDVSSSMKTTKLVENIKTSLKNLRNTIFKANPLIIMVQLHVQKTLSQFRDMEASIHGHIKPSENKLLDFTQSVIITSDLYTALGYLDENEINNYLQELDKLYTNTSIYINLTSTDELISYAQGMQIDVSGILYPYFEKEHFTDLLFPYNNLLNEIFGITSLEIVDGLLKISKHLRTMGFMGILRDYNVSPEDLSEEDFLNMAEYFDVQRITGWPIKFIQELSLQQGEYQDFYEDELQVMLKESPIKYKPFICINDKYYCFSINNLMDNFYRVILRVMRGKKNSFSNRINEIQNDLSEALPLKFFKSILPKASMFSSVYYKAPVGANGKNEWCECDGIILYDDVMIIIEVKGGAISPISPISDPKAYKNSLNNLARDSYQQSLRFFEEYKKTNKIKIYSKKDKKNYTLITSIENIKFIHACCVTLDDFNEVAAQIEKTEFIQSSDLPVWCVSVSDLRVYPELFDSPSLFLNYLFQRSHATKNPYIKLNDELDHLGMYFAYNDYSTSVNEVIKDYNIDNIYIDGHREEINAYMARKLNPNIDDEGGNIYELLYGPVPKPQLKMEPIFADLIKLLDQTKDQLYIRVARYFLLLNLYSRDDLTEFLSSRSKRLLESRRRRGILTPYMAFNYDKEKQISELPVMMVFLLHSSNKLFRNAALRKLFLMERVIYEDEPIYCVLIGINSNKKFTKVITQIIEPKQFQALPVAAYKQLKNSRMNIDKSRNSKELKM